MMKFAMPALAALALAACDSTPADTGTEADADVAATADTSMAGTGTNDMAGDSPAPAPTVTETVGVDVDANVPNSVTIDGRDVDATVGEDGVTAKVKVD